jgi:hypothetical protein
MIRTRLREAHPDEAGFYSGRYPAGYNHTVWSDHVERIAATVSFAAPWLDYYNIRSVADLSAGDGALVRGLLSAGPLARWSYVGDLNPGPELTHGMAIPGYTYGPTGTHWINPDPLPLIPGVDMLDHWREGNPVDLMVCSETLEHLDDPDTYLSRVRSSARSILITTPENETGTGNAEHYWGWDSEAVSSMLHTAGWNTVDHRIFQPQTADVYKFQFWMAHR